MPADHKSTRVNDAYDRLKQEIRAGRMPPGYQATEPEFAAHLGMSRTPVREALTRLQAEGLIELIPRHGARVLALSPADMAEIYDILSLLEPEAAATLAERRPSALDLAPLTEATDRMEQALAAHDLEAWAEADDAFHTRLLDMQDNRRLREYLSMLFDQAHRARMLTLRLRDPPVRSTAEHRDILRHIQQGDAAGARRAFRQHRKRAARELLGLLDRTGLARL